ARQRWVDRVLGPPVCWLATLLQRRHGPEPAAADVRRILIVTLSEMGALIMTRPMFDRLREKHPSATFYVLCSDRNRAALDLIDAVPSEQVVTVSIDSLMSFAKGSIDALRRVRALRFDAVLDLELFARASAVLTALSGAPIKVGFDRFTQEGLYRGGAINRPV